MIPLQVAILMFVAIAATAVVLARDPLRQAIVNGAYGLLLTILFLVFQAPDVALSMLVVGSIAYPTILLVAIKKVASERRDRE
jgi:energy-converting hydrogenase B subunit D